MTRRLRSWTRDEEAVSDVMGSILLVAITVLMMAGLAAVVLSVEGPAERMHARLDVQLHPGPDGAWGTGDEELRVRHLGGPPLPREGTTVRLVVDGQLASFSGSALDGAFADDGQLAIGETWVHVRTLDLGVAIAVDVVHDGAAQSAIVATAQMRAPAAQPVDCSADTQPPHVTAWVQDPSDVNVFTTGPVQVTATLADNCSGVDAAADPVLRWRVNDGSDPPFQSAGAMTGLGGSKWAGTVPAQDWSLHLGDTLQYYLEGLRDLNGNTGNSVLRQDVIGVVGTTTYVTDAEVDVGSLEDFQNAQQEAGTARLTEENVGGGATPSRLDADQAVSSSGWTNPQNAFQSNNQYARTQSTSPAPLRYGVADPATSGQVTSLVVAAEVRSGHTSNQWTLQACIGGGTTCTAASSPVNTPVNIDTTITYDVTALRPGGGAWTVADVNNLQVVVQASGSGNRVYQVDHVYADATVDGAVQRLDITFEHEGVPAAQSHILELRYRVETETFRMLVWDGLTWNERAVLTSTTPTTHFYAITAAEYNAGGILVRFEDVDPNNAVAGRLLIDYSRVVGG